MRDHTIDIPRKVDPNVGIEKSTILWGKHSQAKRPTSKAKRRADAKRAKASRKANRP